MKYAQALAAARKVGAAKAGGDALLAQTASLAEALGPFVPRWVYAGAKAQGMTARELARTLNDNAALNELQWAGCETDTDK